VWTYGRDIRYGRDVRSPNAGERGAGCEATAEGGNPSEPPQGDAFGGSNPPAPRMCVDIRYEKNCGIHGDVDIKWN